MRVVDAVVLFVVDAVHASTGTGVVVVVVSHDSFFKFSFNNLITPSVSFLILAALSWRISLSSSIIRLLPT